MVALLHRGERGDGCRSARCRAEGRPLGLVRQRGYPADGGARRVQRDGVGRGVGVSSHLDLPLAGRSKFAKQISGGGKCGAVRTPTRKIARAILSTSPQEGG